MATPLSKNDYKGRYNNPTTGKYKANTTQAITSAEHRDMIDNSDSFFNLVDDTYTAPFPQVSTTGTNTYAATLSPPISSYATGQKFQIKFTNASTGVSTLNLNGVAAKKIFLNPTTQAESGDIVDEQIYLLIYDAALDAAVGGFLMIGGGGGGNTVSSWKSPVRVATTAAGTLATDFAHGATVDGTSIVTGNRILIKNQALASENGIYVVNPAGAPTRATDADGGTELEGAAVTVQVGTVNANTPWIQTSDVVTIGTHNQVWAQLGMRLVTGNASEFVKTDANKDFVTVPAASQSDMITGTDDSKVATAKSVEDKRSVKSVSISNGATGSTNIDCGLKQEVNVIYNTTVTGGITITKSNDSNLEILNIKMPITGSNIGITFPSDARMSRYNEVSTGDGWYQSTKILQVSSVGTADLWEFSLIRIGSVFKLNYDGPARA